MPESLTAFVVNEEQAGRRLDLVVASALPHQSRAAVQRWIREGLIKVDDRPAKASLLVAKGSTIQVAIPPPTTTQIVPEALPLTVVYEDADLIVVDKPAGLVVHPGAGHRSGTLVNALLHHASSLSAAGGNERPGIVHRLDKGTSGLMVIARHDAAHRNLARQFHDRVVTKTYVALVWGTPATGLVMDAPLGRDPRNRLKISSRAARARPARTEIVSVEALGGVSLVTVQIATGRTHQIRVHLSEAGFPVVGDALYGGDRRMMPARFKRLTTLTRPFLHAARLEFRHPADGRLLSFESSLPEELLTAMSVLRPGSSGHTEAR